jgi:hypothetical protein
MVDAAKAAAQDARRTSVTLELSGDAESVRVRAATRDAAGAYAAEMAAVCGGTMARENETLVLTLPSLTELRRRERGRDGAG